MKYCITGKYLNVILINKVLSKIEHMYRVIHVGDQLTISLPHMRGRNF